MWNTNACDMVKWMLCAYSNAVHDARIVDNLGKFILNCSFVCMWAGTFGTICALKWSSKMLGFYFKTNMVE